MIYLINIRFKKFMNIKIYIRLLLQNKKLNKFLNIILALFLLSFTVVSCKEGSTSEGSDDITISSSASDNASVVFGQSYQYQLTTSGTYSGTTTYTLSSQPDGMTISSSGLVEWTPS